MNYWLIKTEPSTYGWEDLVRDKKTRWDGVHNFRARKNLKAMKKGDLAFFYHTGDEKSIIGIATIVRAAYPDPGEPEWVAVDVAPKNQLARPVALARVKEEKKLANMVLVRVARLSVQPVTPDEFKIVMALSRK